MAGFAYGLGTGISGAEQASQQNLTNQEHLAQMQSQQAQTAATQFQTQQAQQEWQARQLLGQKLKDSGGIWTPDIVAHVISNNLMPAQDAAALAYRESAIDKIDQSLANGTELDGVTPASPEYTYWASMAKVNHDPSLLTKYDPTAAAHLQAETAAQAASAAKAQEEVEATKQKLPGELKAQTQALAESQATIAEKKAQVNKTVADIQQMPVTNSLEYLKAEDTERKALEAQYEKNRSALSAMWGGTLPSAETYVRGSLNKEGFTDEKHTAAVARASAVPTTTLSPKVSPTSPSKIPPGATPFVKNGKPQYYKGKPVFIPAGGGPPSTA